MMTNETTHKRQMFLFNIHCETANGTVGDWTAVAATPEAAHILVQRRLLWYFGNGIVRKLPTYAETKITQICDASAEILKNPGLQSENVTFPALTFSVTF